MVAPPQSLELHTESLPSRTLKSLEFLSKEPWLSESGWYLAGGTALALQVGHRQSVDLDFFTEKKEFEDIEVLSHFADNKDWKSDVVKKSTIYGELFGAKISFIAYPFFVPKQTFLMYGSIRIIRPIDIAVMKVIAISQRGRKRDFFDLYWTAQHIEPIVETVKRLKEQYPTIAHNYHHILKSLVYFDDAEPDPAPEIYFQATWEEVKTFFRRKVPWATEQLMDLK